MATVRRLAFLPGAAGSGEFWSPVAERLLGVEIVSFDWPGFGDVPLDPGDPLTCYEDLASMVIDRLDGPTVLVGQSMGGVVAAMVVRRRPDLVSHLVLAATSGGVDVSSLGAVDWRPGSRAANPMNPSWMWDERPDLTDTLCSLDIPVLLVWATADPISPLAVGEHLHRLIPRSRLSVYDCDDHWVARVHDAEVAAGIEALMQVDSPRA